MPNKLNSFLQLIRIPNLWTIPADIFLGYFLVLPSGKFALFPLLALLVISSFIYSAGLILNDLMDYEEDRMERPNRPLPSGAITLIEARSAYIAMNLLALVVSAFFSQTALILTSLIIFSVFLYNGPARSMAQWGFIQMGFCRLLNVLLGASLFFDHWTALLLFVALAEGDFIRSVTALAYEETKALPKRSLRLSPLYSIITLNFVLLFVLTWSVWLIVIMAGFVLYLYFILRPLLQDDFPIAKLPPKIGQLIRFLIVYSAMVILLVRPEYCSVSILLLASLPVAQWTSKRFYSS